MSVEHSKKMIDFTILIHLSLLCAYEVIVCVYTKNYFVCLHVT